MVQSDSRCKRLFTKEKSVLNVHESASLGRWRRQTTHLTPIPYLAECGRPMYPVHVTKNHGMALMDNLSSQSVEY